MIDSLSKRFPVLDLITKTVDSFGKLKNGKSTSAMGAD
jgi:hypothetical protein